MKTAIQLRDESLQQVEDNANAEWTNLVIKLIRDTALSSFTLTSDDIWLKLRDYPDVQTHQPSAMGAMFKAASHMKLITATDRFIASKRPSSHARPIRVWQSNFFEGN
jgi:hypothetical protein